MTRLAAVFGVVLCACGASVTERDIVVTERDLEHGVAFSDERCFEGEWTEVEGEARQRFSFLLRLSVEGERATGVFHWRAEELSMAPRLVGREAREVLEGSHRDGRLELEGTRIEDPSGAVVWLSEHLWSEVRPFMDVDRYRLAVTPSRMVGLSRTHEGDWSGTLIGEPTPCRDGR